MYVCVTDDSRPSTFPRGRCPVSTSSTASPASSVLCSCGVSDCTQSHDRDSGLSRSASSSSSGIGSMGFSDTTAAASLSSGRQRPSAPTQKCKFLSGVRIVVLNFIAVGYSLQCAKITILSSCVTCFAMYQSSCQQNKLANK